MLVLHALWRPEGVLSLWAEDSERPVRGGRSSAAHPFAAAVEEFVPGKPHTVEVLLPSTPSAPLDSPELVRVTPRPKPRGTPTLHAWSVPAVTLDPAAALAFLTEPDLPAEAEIRLGASVHHFAEVASFATDLAANGRVLPELVRTDDGPHARWRPVLQGHDVIVSASLAAALPPVGRAAPGGPGADEVISSALRALTDAAVRRGLPDALSLLPPRRGRKPAKTPAADAWLAALTAPDGRFDADAADLDRLDAALAPWADIGVGRAGPARATFRLSYLEETDEWVLEFLLQSTEDPSLLVPAAHAWSGDDTLRRWLDRPQELLLGELGRACRVYPELAARLRQAHPTHLDLDVHAANHFLSTAAPALDEAGFGVLLPSWWGRRQLGLRLSARSSGPEGVVGKPGRVGRDQLVDFSWQLAVGDDDALTVDEVDALVEAKAPLVRLRGQWVSVDRDQLQRGLEFLRRGGQGSATAAEILALATRHPDDLDVPLADGWLGDLLDGSADRTLDPVAPPENFAARLRPYQERGLSWLTFLSALGLGACLADDMGLGKTVQLLALEATQRAQFAGAGPTLLVCPMSLVGNWQKEAAKFAPDLRVHAQHGAHRPRGDALRERVADADLILTTYATVTRDLDELGAIDWHRVVLDEAQAVKNSRSRAAQAVRQLRATHRIALTGTPVENRLAELWSIMDFLNPGLLGTPEVFRTRYAIPVERYQDPEPARRLRALTRPYVLRRVKTDPTIIDDLPEKIELKQYCRLTAEQASLYQVVVDDMMAKIADSEGIERRGNVLAAMAKLKQVCNHPAQLLHDRSPIGRRSGKVIRLEEILDEILASGEKVLCFSQFTEFAEMLVPHLSARFDTAVSYLHGGTTKKRRDELVERFQSGDGPPIFLLSLKAGGTGLNLTAANHVIHLDRWWNPAVENQATDRAFRIGQTRGVEVHKFVCTGTLEAMIEEKRALADLVVRDGEGWLTELSTQDLRDVFALTEGAVGD